MTIRKGMTGIATAVAAMAFAASATAQDAYVGSLGDTIAVHTITSPDGIAGADGVAPYLVGTLPFAAFELSASAGYLVYATEARVTSPLGSVVVKDSGDDFTVNAGAGLAQFDTFNKARPEYESFDVEDIDDVNALSLADAPAF